MDDAVVNIIRTLILKFESNSELWSSVDRNNNSANSGFLLF